MIVVYILLGAAALFVAGLIGYAIASESALKDLLEIQDDVTKLYDGFKKSMELDDKLIGAYRKLIKDTYNYLVHVRDGDADDISVVIDKLGEVIGNTTVKEPENNKED
jgi:hypothetical protein